jgi:hypothetical protein
LGQKVEESENLSAITKRKKATQIAMPLMILLHLLDLYGIMIINNYRCAYDALFTVYCVKSGPLTQKSGQEDF